MAISATRNENIVVVAENVNFSQKKIDFLMCVCVCTYVKMD